MLRWFPSSLAFDLSLALACWFGAWVWWGLPHKNRFEYIHVRLGSAIHGSAHFCEEGPTTPV